jgi:hypothetical protein
MPPEPALVGILLLRALIQVGSQALSFWLPQFAQAESCTNVRPPFSFDQSLSPSVLSVL